MSHHQFFTNLFCCVWLALMVILSWVHWVEIDAIYKERKRLREPDAETDEWTERD